jgi:hypothetical protein
MIQMDYTCFVSSVKPGLAAEDIAEWLVAQSCEEHAGPLGAAMSSLIGPETIEQLRPCCKTESEEFARSEGREVNVNSVVRAALAVATWCECDAIGDHMLQQGQCS